MNRAGEAASSAFAPTRDLAVSVFVVWREQVLLHRHRKLGLWLPAGREVLEETGVVVELVGERAVDAPGPVQLVRPRGVQLESIAPGHEHIDLVYLARPSEPYDGRLGGDEEGLGWYGPAAAVRLGLTPEMAAWVDLAFREL